LRRKDIVSAQLGETATIVVPEPALLRDYFLRLGLEAEIADDGVRVDLQGDVTGEHSIQAYLQNWVNRNGVHATIQLEAVPAPAPARPVAVPAATSFQGDRPRLGDLLQRKGLITAEQLQDALAQSRATNDLLGRVLIRRRYIFGDELARTLADQLDLPFVNLRVIGYERSVAVMLPSELGLRLAALPIGVVGNRIRVAVADPTDEEGLAAMQPYLGSFSVCVADLLEIELAWKTLDPATAAAARVA
jgi:hypothetical protein